MKTSSNNIRTIENYLLGRMSPADRFLFEAQLLINPTLRMDLYAQKKALALIRMYHRKKQKEELEVLHHQIFSNPAKAGFKQQISQLFKREER